MMSSLNSEFPEMSGQELFYHAFWAQNTRDQYLGFTPLQHMLGKNPDALGNIHDHVTMDLPIITERGVSAEFGRDEKAMKHAEEAFIEQPYKQRLQRAQQSGPRPPRTFQPGDLVFYFRRQLVGSNREMGNQNFKNSAFLGPARVLATETRVNSDGTIRPGSCVWLCKGNRIIKASPEQLRAASERGGLGRVERQRTNSMDHFGNAGTRR